AGLRKSELSGIGSAVSRLRISYIHHVIFVDVNRARPSELIPLRNELPVLIEDLNAVVLTVSDEKPSPRIERQGVNNVELAGPHALFSPGHQKLPGLVELHNSGVAVRGSAAAVSVGDEDVPVRSDRNLRWRIELVQPRPSDTLLPERQQHLPVLIHLEDLLPAVIRDPQESILVDRQLVGADEDPGAEGFQPLTLGVGV